MGILISPHLPSALQSWSRSPLGDTSVRVCFSPEGQCAYGIIRAIQEATSSIYVQAYSFTSAPIAEALGEAKKRGIDVRVLMDKSQIHDSHSQISFLAHQGIPIFIDVAAGLAHNKIMIFDERSLLTGSFNFTKAANCRNAENVLILYNTESARIYKKKWDERALKAKLYKIQ